MTTDQLRDLRDAIDAHLHGKPVQCAPITGTWIDNDKPTFSSLYLWRPKPEPKVRAWTLDEVPAGVVVCSKEHPGKKSLIVAVEPLASWPIKIGFGGIDAERLLQGYTQLDGSPCTVTE